MTYTVFAGINGAGKSTLYETGMFSDIGVRINIDNIAREHNEQYAVFPVQAGKIAIEKINFCIENKTSFNQETTLSGRSALQTIRRAKEAGFKVVMLYVYIDSPERAIQRIAYRVSKGGHFIEDEIVKRRYHSSLHNLKEAVGICDEIYIFDNSSNSGQESNGRCRLLCFVYLGTIIEKADDMPQILLNCLGL